MDLLVGRDDGSVEIYGFDEADEPVKRFTQVIIYLWSFAYPLYINYMIEWLYDIVIRIYLAVAYLSWVWDSLDG